MTISNALAKMSTLIWNFRSPLFAIPHHSSPIPIHHCSPLFTIINQNIEKLNKATESFAQKRIEKDFSQVIGKDVDKID